MTGQTSIKLTELTQKINECSTAEQKTELLTRAFEFYSQETVKLEKAHGELIRKFEQLQNEFTETNLYLKIKLDELDAVNDYLTNLIYNMSQGLIFIDLRGRVTTYNRMAEEILGIPLALVLFNSFWEAFSDDFFGFSMRKALNQKTPPTLSYLTFETNGIQKELELDINFVLQTDPPEGAADFQGMILLVRDLTEIRRLENIEKRNDRMKQLGEMAGMVAHEIRNPLGGIKGFASLLERDLQDRPEQQQMAAYIVEATENLNNLVTNVLSYSRPLKAEFLQTDIIELCRELLNHIKADDNTPKNINFIMNEEITTLPIVIDPALIKGALLNLIFNGIQAMPNGGTLTLSIRIRENSAIIIVSDTGIGISPENLKKLFSPFFTTKPKGNGFGLPEVFKVIEAHQGTIEVESTLGKGTTLTIQLPLKGEHKETKSCP